MEKTMQSNIFNANRIPFSPRTRQSSGSSFVSGAGRKSLLPGIKKGSTSGRYSLSGRSNQSLQIIARSEYNVVENFGLPLPVLLNEALTFSERNSSVSINCSENGWAWAVTGRRLLVWQYKDTLKTNVDVIRTPQRRTASAQCRELTLPHCDIGHKASLISVFIPEEQQMASCLAVSPTGDARYWPSIAHDGSSIDASGILEGQEFDYLENISPQGYVLATTTCNLVMLQLVLQNGRHVIHHRTIKPPSGFFGGIGKKFASIIIGMNSGQDKENRFVKLVSEKDEDSWFVTVLADRWLQRWAFSEEGSEHFLYETHEIFRKIRDEFQHKFWSNREHDDIEVTFLDMQNCDNKLHILCGAVNNTHTPQMYYAIATIESEAETWKLLLFTSLKLTLFYSPGNENECLKMRFILNRGMAYLYSDKTIYPVNLGNPSEIEVEKIEFHSQNDKIMRAIVAHQIPLFFTRAHGLVCVSPSDFDSNDYINNSDIFTPGILSESFNQSIISPNITSINMGNLTMYDLDPDEIFKANKDEISQMKAAFVYHLKRNTVMCNTILADIVPPNKEKIDEVDSVLDKIVIAIAEDLAEDIPAADPRWEHQDTWYQNKSVACLGSSISLQILTQLKEKNMAMNHFIEFLHATELWERLHAVSQNGKIKSTCHVLAEINEKIIAAIALKCAQNSYSKIIDEAIYIVLDEWNEVPLGNLVHQDLFYVKLTKFQDIFRALSKIADKTIQNQSQTSLVAEILVRINDVILIVLNEILNFRENKAMLYSVPPNNKTLFEYLPWTASSGKNGLKDTILHFIEITNKYGIKATGDSEVKQKLYQQLVDLIDFVLNGRKNYLDSVKDNEKYNVLLQQYESQRRDLIFPLVEEQHYELAAKLAEKYLDFQTLIVICDQTENQQRLNEYIERYQEYDFSQFAINWHLRQNKQGDLFERFKENQAALSQFLGDHPSLAWIQLVFNGDLERAAEILLRLAKDEVEYVSRKKTILSLAKLAYLATDSTDISIQMTEINNELTLIEYQEQLPEELLQTFGYDIENQKVLKAEEMIHLLISEENESAMETDYLKALELINYTDDPIDSRHKIWCAAILRDNWTDVDMNIPMDQMENMMFFKLIDLCYFMNHLDDFLPPQHEILSSMDLDDLVNNKSFQYLLKLGYEHIYNTYQRKNVMEE
ncbi:nuclear pore complex protein Nup133 [Condylostylus longicornis]|uniref:nuclear pore complex protein Nup133 n=1 Tax=Condylostylus longicornis TaxID=2530218 RepID=UPI00244DB93B|nr:nuclear pore complex protein Nup133 [Condylostylus longicornis]